MSNLNNEGRYFRNPMVPYKEYKRISYEPGRVARIKLNRPRYLNVLSHAVWGELEDAIDRASEDPACHVIVLSGEGRCFCAGDDTNGLTPESAPCLVTDETREELLQRFPSESALWHAYNIEHDYYPLGFATRWQNIPKPTIAMVHGYCIFAGFMVATAMDLVFTSEDALFLGPPSVYDVGPRKYLELAYEHRFITAREAYDFGLVSRVYPNRETLEKETLAYAERVANQVPAGLRRTKQGFIKTMDLMGRTTAYGGGGSSTDIWVQLAQSGHPERYEGRGMARTPVALYNLAVQMVSAGTEVPEHLVEALQRAAVRDDRGAWQRALHQGGREAERVARAEADAKAWDEKRAKEGVKDIKDMIRDLLAEQKWGIPDRIETT